MSCCKDKEVAALSCCCDKTEFWNWWKTTEKTYTAEEVFALLEKVKEFNAGAIDQYLTNHVDKAFDEWRKSLA